MCTYQTTMSVHIPHINSIQSTLLPKALVYIHFTLMKDGPDQTCLPHCSCMCHCIQTPHCCIYNKTNKQVCHELCSNMHMYYEFCNDIYSSSAITTYALLVWQTYFVFCIYANNFGNCTHMHMMPMKC